MRGSKPRIQKKMILPSVRKARFDNFKKVWQSLDEDTKQVIAGSLFVLNHAPVERVNAIQDTLSGFDKYHFELLAQLTRFTENV